MGEEAKVKFRWLAPYPSPADNSIRRIIISSSCISLFIFIFLLFFRPLGLPRDYSLRTIVFIFGFAIITFSVCIFYTIILPHIWIKPFKSSNWNLIKSILYTSLLILTIALSNIAFISLYQGSFSYEGGSAFFFIFGTFIIGVIPAAFVHTVDYLKSNSKYQKESANLLHGDIIEHSIEKEVMFESNYDEEGLSMNLSDFLFVEAEGNYITIYSKTRPKRMLRNSLKYVKSLLEHEEIIMQTHRSFIVNLANVSSVSGNAQGFVLAFNPTKNIARVSRANTQKVKKHLSELN